MFSPKSSKADARPLLRVAAWPLAVACALYNGSAAANPSGADVVAGQVAITQSSPSTLQVQQSTHSAIVNWQQFSVGSGEQVRFDQPSASAAILNRVVGGDASQILGNLSANGRVFLVNPQGVMFGAGSRVDVGSLVASTLDIADDDFLSGQLVFADADGTAASVLNRGEIRAAEGGFVVLAGGQVGNEGLIHAQLGDVALLSGSELTLSLDPGGLVGYSVDKAALGAAAGVDNAGDLVADGGQVVMSASVARDLAATAVNNRGRIRAQAIEEREGEIYLQADGGSIRQSGSIDVSSAAGDGGRLVAEADGDIQIVAGSRAVAIGGSQGRGGEQYWVAQRDLDFAPGAQIDVRGGAGGGKLELSGLGRLRVGGELRVGAGGQVLLDPGEFTIGNGSAAQGCTAGICEEELEALLQDGSGVSIISDTGILFEDLADNMLEGQRADGLGGYLYLGVGTGSFPAAFQRGSTGSISFADVNDSLLLDGSFEAYAGSLFGTIDIGHVVNREFMFLDAADGVHTGSLTQREGGSIPFITVYSQYGDIRTGGIDARQEVYLSGATGVVVDGSIRVTGSNAGLDPDAFVVIGGRLDIDGGVGGIFVNGGLSITGEVLRFDGGQGFSVRGAYANLVSGAGDIVIAGPVTLDGTIGTVTGGDNWSALAAQLRIEPENGAIELQGDLILNGRLDQAIGGDGIFARGSEAVLGVTDDSGFLPSTDITVLGQVAIDGHVGVYDVLGSGEAVGGFFQLNSAGGTIRLFGPVGVSGSVDTAFGVDDITIRGAHAEMFASGGDLLLGSTLTVTGDVGYAAGNFDMQVNGAALFLTQDSGLIYLGGTATAVGTIGQSFGNDGTRTRAANLDIIAHDGSIYADADVVASGSVGEVGAGHESYTNGAFLRLSAGEGGDVYVAGSIDASGVLLDTSGGDSMFANAAEINLDGLNVGVDGDVRLLGRNDVVEAGESAFVVGAYLDLRALGSDAVVGGAVDVQATLGSVSAGNDSRGQAVFIGASAPNLLQFGSLRAEGHSGSVRLGDYSFSNGVFVDLAGYDVHLLGGLGASGSLDSTTGGYGLSAEATDVFIRGVYVGLDGDVQLGGQTGNVIAGDDSFISGTLLDVGATYDLTLGGGLTADGSLLSVSGDPSGFAPAGLFARATSVLLNSEAGTLSVGGDISLTGDAGTVVVGSDSGSNGIFLGLFAVYGNVLVHGDIRASGSLGTTDGGDYLFAQGTQLRAVGQYLGIDGSVVLDGRTGDVTGGFQSFVAGSALYFYSDSDIVIGGGIDTTGTLGSVSAFGESFAQAVSLDMDADFGAIDITGSLRAVGDTGSTLLGYSSFSNGVFVDLSANIVTLRSDLDVSGTLGSTTGGLFLNAAAADVLINALLIDIDGDVLLQGNTGTVAGGQGSYVTGSLLAFNSSYDTRIGGDLVVGGQLGSVTGSDPEFASDFLFARATSVALTADYSGSVTIGGNVVLDGITGTVQAGNDSYSNGVFLTLSATDFEFRDSGKVVIGGTLTANGSLGSTVAGDRLFARATDIYITSNLGMIDLRGDIALSGSNASVVTGFSSFVNAISVVLEGYSASTRLGGNFSATGTLEEVRGFSGLFARATELRVTTTGFGLFEVDGNLDLTGTVGTVDTGEGLGNNVSVNAVYASVGYDLNPARISDQGNVLIHGNVSASGTLGLVIGGSTLTASTAELSLFSGGGILAVDGDLSVIGNRGLVRGSNETRAFGSLLSLVAQQGDVSIGGSLSASGTLDSVSAEDFSFARAVALIISAESGTVDIGGNVNAEGHTGSAVLGNESFSSGAFVDISGDDVLLQGNLVVTGTLDATTLGSNTGAEAAAMLVQAGSYQYADDGSIAGINGGALSVTGSVSLDGSTGSVVAGDQSFIAGSFISLSTLGGELSIGGSLGATGTLDEVRAGSSLFARAAELRIGNGSTVFDADFNEILLGGGNVSVGGDISLVGSTGSVESGDSSFVAGSFLDLSTLDGDILVGGNIGAIGTLSVVDGGDGLEAQAAQLRVHGGSSTFHFDAEQGTFTEVLLGSGDIRVMGNITLDGTTGSVSGGVNTFMAGSVLDLVARGGDIDIDGQLRALGALGLGAEDTIAAGDLSFARAVTLTVSAGEGRLTVDGDVRAEGHTGSATLGSDSSSSGTFVSLSADSLLLGGSLGAIGSLAATSAGDNLFAAAATMQAQAGEFLFDGAGNRIGADGGDLVVSGSILLDGSTGSISAGNNSFIAGSFLAVSALDGNVRIAGDLGATGTLETVSAGDNLFARAAELRVQGGARIFDAAVGDVRLGSGSVSVGGDISLDGTTGSVAGGSNASMTGSVLDVTTSGGGVDIGGQLRARGSLGLGAADTVSGGDFSFARAVALTVASDGSLVIDGDVLAQGQTGSATLGEYSFSNGIFVLLSADSLQLGGNIDALASLAATRAGNGLFAEAATVQVQAGRQLFDAGGTPVGASGGDLGVAGNVSLAGNTGSITAGDDSFVAGSFLDVSAFNGDVIVGGSLAATGSLDTVSAGDNLFARAAELRIHAGSAYTPAGGTPVLLGVGDIIIGGGISLDGTTGSVSGGSNTFMLGSALDVVAIGGDVDVTGDLSALGSLGRGADDTVSAGDASFAQAVALTINADGSARIGGSLSANGQTGSATLGDDSFSNGVFLGIYARDASIGGGLSASGLLDSTDAGDRLFARATALDVRSSAGGFSLGGDLVVTGATGNVSGLSEAFVNGVFVSVVTVGGGSSIGGNVQIQGSLGSVQAGDGAAASGAELQALTDGSFTVGGGLRAQGTLDSFSAGNDSGAFGADVFVFSGSDTLRGDTLINGPVEVSGELASVEGGSNLYSYGAFASFSSRLGDVRLGGPVSILGSLGSVSSGDTLDLSGVGFWANTTRGNIQLGSSLSVNGSVVSVQAGNGAFLNGAFAFLTAADGTLGVAGDITLAGSLGSVQGGSDISASGADLVLERSGSRALAGADLSLGGRISETGSIGSFSVADTASSSSFSGGVLVNANDGSIFFRDIDADNAFVYFNQDSLIESSHLLAREYLEIVTPSSLPVLSGQELTITAPEVFLSANMDFVSLSANGDNSLVISAAQLHGDTLRLTGAGLIQLANGESTTTVPAQAANATALSGDSVFISGGRVLSDAGTLIDAGGLDVIATDTIRLAGIVRIGTGLAQDPGDTALLDLIAAQSPELLPSSSGPNAYFQAPTVALASLTMAGDYLHIESNTTQLGTVSLQPGTLVHLDPLVDLPFFAESVDVDGAGLTSVKDRLNTEDNRVVPNLGPFNAAQGDQALTGRPVLDDTRTDEASDPTFTVGSGVPTLSDLILTSGLAGSTIVIGASDYTAGIQIADQLVVNVLPSNTNFIFATTSLVLLTQPIQTNGDVFVVGGGRVETDRDVFYKLLVEQINAYFAALNEPDEYDGEVEEKTRNEEDCEE